MTNRTLQFLGAAYGNSDITITATIDNVVVYNNTVTTLDEEIPLPEDLGNIVFPTLFSVENSDQFPIEFAGARTMSLTVTGGEGIILTNVLSNYMEQTVQIGTVSRQAPGNATAFVVCYKGIPTNSEGTIDCRSSVILNGNVQVPPLTPSTGTWTWEVNTGSTLVCNLNVSQGNVA
jgi:hypothetical protein